MYRLQMLQCVVKCGKLWNGVDKVLRARTLTHAGNHAASRLYCCYAVLCSVRSTFPGAGRFTGHWTGDTKVSWRSFREQTANILNANMWGLAMTGADICGYGIEGPPIMTDEQLQELCVR